MGFSFKSIGHALATGLSDAYKGATAVEKFIAKVATPGNEAEVEALTALIPTVGPEAATIERGVFAVAGEVGSLLSDITGAGEKALLGAGFDASIIADFKALIAGVPGLVTGKTTATVVS